MQDKEGNIYIGKLKRYSTILSFLVVYIHLFGLNSNIDFFCFFCLKRICLTCRKSLEGKEREHYEKKRKIRNALAGFFSIIS